MSDTSARRNRRWTRDRSGRGEGRARRRFPRRVGAGTELLLAATLACVASSIVPAAAAAAPAALPAGRLGASAPGAAPAPLPPRGEPSRPTPAATKGSPLRPNLVVVLSDDHRWDALGAAGNRAIVTPVMDRLAHEGVHFRQATTSVSQCHPVRATLLTGLPSFRHGVYSVRHQEADAAATLCARPTLPALLRAAGYRTVMVGKWHVPAAPWDCGFDDVRTWLPEGGARFHEPELVRGRSGAHEVVPGFTQEIFAADALAFLRSEEAAARPFLLWLGFTAPHFPHAPNPARIEQLYAGREAEALLPPGFPRDVAANDWRAYDEAVSHLDEQIGRVVDTLRERGLLDDTVVVVLGDNGFMMGERGLGGPGARSDGKVVPYEGSLRVPFLMSGPGFRVGAPSDLPVSSLDLPPTLLGLAGVTAPAAWPGRDLRLALAGGATPGEAFSEWSDEVSDTFGALAFRAVRTPGHKLILWKDPLRGVELYDLAADPGERRNLAAEPAAAPIRRDLQDRLRAWMQRNEDPALGWPAARALAAAR